jgi:hypothetical protein
LGKPTTGSLANPSIRSKKVDENTQKFQSIHMLASNLVATKTSAYSPVVPMMLGLVHLPEASHVASRLHMPLSGHNSSASALQLLLRGVFPHLSTQFFTFSVMPGPDMPVMLGAPAHEGMSQLPEGLMQSGTSVAFVANARVMKQVADNAPLEEHAAVAVHVSPWLVRPHSNLQTPSRISAPLDVNAGSGADQHVVDMQLLVPFVQVPSRLHVAFSQPWPPLQALAVHVAPADVLRQTRCHSMVLTKTPAGRSGNNVRGKLEHRAAHTSSSSGSSSSIRGYKKSNKVVVHG